MLTQKCTFKMCVYILCTYCVCIVIREFTYVLRVFSGSFLEMTPVSGSTVVKIHLQSKYTPDIVITKHADSMGEQIRHEPGMKIQHFCKSLRVRVS